MYILTLLLTYLLIFMKMHVSYEFYDVYIINKREKLLKFVNKL